MHSVDGRSQAPASDSVRRFVIGSGAPAEIVLICGYFEARYGHSIPLFETLSAPIVEQFDVRDQLDHKLKSALAEFMSREIGSEAMSAALLKQVMVALLRRSLTSASLWTERFSLLSDPQIARVFSVMAARPGAPHTLQSLSAEACLSRSAFMARFTEILGRPPMTVLRDLRLRQAAGQLQAGTLTLEQIAHNAGYDSRSSFVRAFQKAYGRTPSDYRAALKRETI